jgi:serine/threonine protein kinase
MQVNVLAKMKHPNIVKYFDCFMDPNYLIIIMEYCNAGDLTGLIKAQTGQLLPEKHIMFLFVQVSLV